VKAKDFWIVGLLMGISAVGGAVATNFLFCTSTACGQARTPDQTPYPPHGPGGQAYRPSEQPSPPPTVPVLTGRAFQFTDEAGEVRCSLKVKRGQDGRPVLEMSDESGKVIWSTMEKAQLHPA
jgi:hypothetical protein